MALRRAQEEHRRAAQAATQEQQHERAYIIARYRREHPEDSLVRTWEDYLAKQKIDEEQRVIRGAERDAALKRQMALEAARDRRRQARGDWKAAHRSEESQPRVPANSVTRDERDAQEWDRMQQSVSTEQNVDNSVQVNVVGVRESGEAHDDAVTAEKVRQVRCWRRIQGWGN